MRSQSELLFPQQFADSPSGFSYQPSLLSEPEQSELIKIVETLPFQHFDFHGYQAKRRVVQFGFQYNFNARNTTPAEPIPNFLLPTRDKAAEFANVPAEKLVEAIIIEYPPGAAMGWHRDVPQFEIVVGISLAGSCRFRLKPIKGGKITSLVLEPGSAYLLSGTARWQYQHSVPAVEKLRYSITLRTLRERR